MKARCSSERRDRFRKSDDGSLSRPPSSGRVHINEGALDAITKKNASLLYAGVTHIENEFEHGDVVSIVGPERTTKSPEAS